MNTNPTITIAVKNVYGNERNYPACDTAKLFCELTGSKTLTIDQLNVIERLGYSIKVDPAEWAGS